ncbi:MAG: glycosyltransferase [Geminicoccaceae bacterium]|nr:MAG: glycosyltransferase [Geminicoccaceae bacterium]
MLIHALGAAGDGGAETFFLSVIDALAAKGVPQGAFLRRHEGRVRHLRQLGVPVATAPFAGAIDPLTAWSFRRFAKRTSPAAVMTWMARASWQVPPGPYRKVGRVGGYYKVKYFQSCDHILAIAPHLADHMVAQGWPRDRVSVVPNFPLVDPTALPVDRATLRTPVDVPLLLSLARLHPVKGLDTLLRALAEVDDAFLWLAGEGPERGRLEQLSRELGVDGRVRFLGWRTDRSALLQAADVVVFPSRQEPLGSVVVEAWASGKPLVATRAAGPAWLARDGDTALLVPVDDIAALADRLRLVTTDPALRSSLAAAGKREVAERYGVAPLLEAYLAVLGLA